MNCNFHNNIGLQTDFAKTNSIRIKKQKNIERAWKTFDFCNKRFTLNAPEKFQASKINEEIWVVTKRSNLGRLNEVMLS